MTAPREQDVRPFRRVNTTTFRAVPRPDPDAVQLRYRGASGFEQHRTAAAPQPTPRPTPRGPKRLSDEVARNLGASFGVAALALLFVLVLTSPSSPAFDAPGPADTSQLEG